MELVYAALSTATTPTPALRADPPHRGEGNTEIAARTDSISIHNKHRYARSSAAFTRFDTALDKTLQINRAEFDHSVEDGFAALAGLDVGAPAVGVVIAVLAFFGMRPRLREYDLS